MQEEEKKILPTHPYIGDVSLNMQYAIELLFMYYYHQVQDTWWSIRRMVVAVVGWPEFYKPSK